MLIDSPRVEAVSIVSSATGNPSCALRNLRAVNQKLSASFPSIEIEVVFSGPYDGPVLENFHASKVRIAQFGSFTRLKGTVCEPPVSTSTVLQDAISGLFGHTGRSTESSKGTAVIADIHSFESSLIKGFKQFYLCVRHEESCLLPFAWPRFVNEI